MSGEKKLPMSPQGIAIDPHDPTRWMSYPDACAASKTSGYGVGFVFTANDPYFFLDIDHCAENGAWNQKAVSLFKQFPGAFSEVSQSGSGLHIIGRAADIPHSIKNAAEKLELYTEKRFCALTFKGARGDAETDHSDALRQVVSRYFMPKRVDSAHVTPQWTTKPHKDWSGPETDGALVKKMLKSRGSTQAQFGGKATLMQLWEADSLGQFFPHPTNEFDHSSADAALCQHLAFWTGKNCAQIERIFSMSALGKRDKWADRKAYRETTILNAVANCKNVYSNIPQPVEVPDDKGYRPGAQYMTITAQVDHFKGCVYIVKEDRAFTPHYGVLKKAQFRAVMGGFKFQHGSKDTLNAWEAFTESQNYDFPKAASSVFRPELAPGTRLSVDGEGCVNTYIPVVTDRKQGDVTPFLRHMGKLLPDRRDYSLFLYYMASLVQNPGVKFQWAPLLQGAEGNGKSFVAKVLTRCIGSKYCHLPEAEELGGRGGGFTGWLANKLFICVEEVYANGRASLMTKLKPLITADRIEIHPKGVDQYTGDNRANFLMCSNHKDAIPVTEDGRRYAIFYCAQQSAADIKAHGMDGEYFPKLWQWAEKEDGWAIINDFLRTLSIPPQHDPAKLSIRAPKTSSTDEALKASRPPIEEKVLNAWEEDEVGFGGDWISSIHLMNLLERAKLSKVSPPALASHMRNIGFHLHPYLCRNSHNKGRISRKIGVDGNKKPRLYVRIGSVAESLTCAKEIADSYEASQVSEKFSPQ
jgi:hypothetical protein